MKTSPTPQAGPGPIVWAALAAAALVHLGFNLWIGFGADDTENLETTRVLAAARQIEDGPGALYGPYSGANPYVLIQAPLYYRLTALGAWPLAAVGVDPVSACFVAGRGISFLSFLGILGLAYRFAGIGGLSWQAGGVAVLLLVGSPMFGSFPVTMRPDMLGVFLQTAGLYGVVRVLEGKRGAPWLIVSYAAFALAVVTKQHYIIGPLLASAWLAWACWQGRLPLGPILLAHAVGLAIGLADLGFEEWLTAGAMSRAIFRLPGDLQRVTAGSWSYVVTVYGETLKRSAGLLVVAAATIWALAGRVRPGRFAAGALAFVALDLALMTKLCLDSSGGWFNYALQATVVVAVLIGRGLVLADRERPNTLRWLPVGLAAVLLLVGDVRTVARGYAARVEAQGEYRALLADARLLGQPDSARYFPGHLQHYNRRIGDIRLTHDEWLYQAFEAIHEAEPREQWLRRALADGPIRLIVTESDAEESARIAGLAEPLTALGYRPAGKVGRLGLWERR